MLIREFLPPGQTLNRWEEMITLVEIFDTAGVRLRDVAERFQSVAAEGCASAPVLSPIREFVDRGYPAIAQTVACAKTKTWGKAEVFVYKMIKGKTMIYQLQRAWRLPAAADPKTFRVSEAVKAAGEAFLAKVFLCDTLDPAHPCPR
jgi:hypothetical protein